MNDLTVLNHLTSDQYLTQLQNNLNIDSYSMKIEISLSRIVPNKIFWNYFF